MLKRTLAAAATAALGMLAAAPGVASAQTARPQSVHVVPASHVLNLHKAFAAALPHVKPGRMAGIQYARGTQPKAAAMAAGAAKAAGLSCAEPDCRLPTRGGPVEHHPRVYLLLWGPTWTTDSGEQASAAYLESFYKGLGASGDHWSPVMGEYGDKKGYPQFTRSVFKGVYTDTSIPPTGATQSDIQAEADTFTAFQHIKHPLDAQIVVATQSGTCPQYFDAPCNGTTGYLCAWHSFSSKGETYTNLPYLPDAGSPCGANILDGPNDGWSIVGGHEYAETVTDPNTINGWWDPNDASGGEIGDKCNWVYPGTTSYDIQNITLSTGTFAVQPLFSNLSLGLAHDGCQILTMPSGNRVKSAKGQCLDNYKGRFQNGNKADVWKCTGANSQYWLPQKGHLYNNGRCLTDVRGKLKLESCKTGKKSQIWWYKRKKHEYVLKSNYRCLTERKTRNGSPVTVAKCRNKRDQHWTKA